MERPLKLGRTWVISALLSAALAAPAAGASPAPGEPPPFVPGELLVQFEPGTSRSEAKAAARAERAKLTEQVEGLPRLFVVDLPPGLGVKAADRAFEFAPEVDRAQPNFVYGIDAPPNDPRFSELWGLDNTGFGGGTPDADIDAPEAWGYPAEPPASATGSADVIAAVIDTGIQADHEDLASNVDIVGSKDFVEEDAVPDDGHGHGTHVAGTIGAEGNNGKGVTGVNWDVSLLALKAGHISGFLLSEDVVPAIDYAATNGAKVVNASFSGSGFDWAQYDAMKKAGEDHDVLFVAAAGNAAPGNDPQNVDLDPEYPCAYDLANVICVASSTRFETLSTFSNYGRTSVDLAAPGSSVLSTYPTYMQKFADNFTTLDAWTSIPPDEWGLSDGVLSDSPTGTYANNEKNSVRTTNSIGVNDPDSCRVRFNARFAFSDTDKVFVEAASGESFTPPKQILSLGGVQSTFKDYVADVPALDGATSLYLRFRLDTNGSETADGIYIDDFRVECTALAASQTRYEYLSGTSMATPHVAGAAALLLAAHPGYEVTDLRTALLNTVDQGGAYGCAVATGGRLNLNSAIQDDANTAPAPPLNCVAGTQSVGQDTSGQVGNVGGSETDDEPERCGGKKATIVGTDRGETIKGTKRADVIAALGGADKVLGRGGNDRICGGDGKDRIFGGPGKDRLFGNAGRDKLAGGPGEDRLAGGGGKDVQVQ